MENIILLRPNTESTEAFRQKLINVFTNYDISVYKPGSSKTKTAFLLVDAADGPTAIASNQLIEMRENKIQNVFGIVYNCSSISDPELLELVKTETKNLLKQYGYFGPEFAIFSDKDNLEQFHDFVQNHINDINQMDFVLPTFNCRFCGHSEHKKFNLCPSCQKKQKESFWTNLFGSKSV